MKNRRDFLKFLSIATVGSTNPAAFASSESAFAGKFLVTVQAIGGWDVSSFCDPKENQIGEQEITTWSREASALKAGNISYAPFARNETFFTKHAHRTLVINGVDAQTNAHDIGTLTNWSGRTASGFPTLPSLYSATFAPEKPMSFISFGGLDRTEGLIRHTMLDHSAGQLSNLLKPNQSYSNSMIDPELWEIIKQVHTYDSKILLTDQTLVAGNRLLIDSYMSSMENTAPLLEFADTLRTGLDPAPTKNYLITQADFAVLAFKAGVSVSANLWAGAFDTHANHDRDQSLALIELTEGLNYLWDKAEEAGIADRLIVVVGSDFSRTPYYNEHHGKDHWPIGSYLVMENGASYSNRVVQGSDEGQNAVAIDPVTLQPSGFGAKILTSHVHDALRSYLGLENLGEIFPINNSVKFDFFS